MKFFPCCWRIILIGYFIYSHVLCAQFLQVSENGRYLEKEDGTPFLYLGDTAWELFHRLSIEEAEYYLENRAEKGFTVIQAVVLAQLGGLTDPNANGDVPLIDNDPLRPVEAYFKHVDAVIDKANELGLVIGLLPTWGRYWTTTNSGEHIFNVANARSFGTYVGNRYKDKEIIWILGGDEHINNEEERSIIYAMADGIEEGDQGNHLITYHPRGPGRSSDYLEEVDWLDFHMFQSSHAGHGMDNGLYVDHDYQLTPIKPTLDGEPRYELIPSGFYFSGANRLDFFNDIDCRQVAYWSMLAGACGHTYGHNSVWQMWDTSRAPVLGARISWKEALDHPGAFQMRYVKRLFESRPFHLMKPDQDLILQGSTEIHRKMRASISLDASFAIIYSPEGQAFTVDQHRIQATKLKTIWYDPRYGISHEVHTGNTFAIQVYTPPTSGRGNDWILILEDAERNFPLP